MGLIKRNGAPEKNTKGLPLKTIGEICTLKSGNSEANKSKPGNLPYVKVDIIRNKW